MQQNGSKYFAPKHTLDPAVELKGQTFFLKVVMLKIKLKRIEHRKQIFCPYTHPRHLRWGQKVIFVFSESGNVA